jgi:hypothetical protein
MLYGYTHFLIEDVDNLDVDLRGHLIFRNGRAQVIRCKFRDTSAQISQ